MPSDSLRSGEVGPRENGQLTPRSEAKNAALGHA